MDLTMRHSCNLLPHGSNIWLHGSAEHFDIEDLKAQASLIYVDEPSQIKEDDVAARIIESEKSLYSRNTSGQSFANENNCSEGNCTTNPDCRRMPNGHENSVSENDSLPSTSKEPESK